MIVSSWPEIYQRGKRKKEKREEILQLFLLYFSQDIESCSTNATFFVKGPCIIISKLSCSYWYHQVIRTLEGKRTISHPQCPWQDENCSTVQSAVRHQDIVVHHGQSTNDPWGFSFSFLVQKNPAMGQLIQKDDTINP